MINCAVLVLAAIIFIGFLIKFYAKVTTGWCKSQTCLAGKTAIVTGANTGIGYETALDFAKRGARVILACRDKKRAEEARDSIVQKTQNDNVVVKIVDMASLSSVRAFAKDINATEERLDILVNNAGAGGLPDKKTEDGILLLMQINYFSAFLLTLLLMGLLKKTKNSRVVNVSSEVAKYTYSFDLNKINVFPGMYYEYCYSKLCNILFTIELAQKLEGTTVTTYSLHPGAVKTEIARHAQGIIKWVMAFMQNMFFKNCKEGAQTTIYCAVAKDIENLSGEHFEDCQKVVRYKTAKVPGLSKKLWEVTESMVHLKPEENPF